ncbi:MAG: virulence-associated E family protein [Oscillospiraceae bacterium]|nr:virulence-associated E family protein [Oscillospiraceae bacterium]
MTTAQLNELLTLTDRGRVKQSKRNCVTVFENDPLLKGAIRHNILTGRTDIVKPLGWERLSDAITDTDMSRLFLYFEDNYELTNEKNIERAVQITADMNRYHPIRDYLNSLVWDGEERIRFVLRRYLGADTSDLTYQSLKLFLLGAIKRVFEPGCKFETMLCLVGGQGVGKSSFFRLLAHRDEWFSDDLRKLEDDNIYRKLQGHWIIEMSEMLATANAKSIEEIKSFISRQKETYKVPYETHPADRPRQCVFGGTSNNTSFLPFDRTGNRRFIPILTDISLAEKHILEDEAEARDYIDQLWAEAMTIYRSGDYSLKLSADMENAMRQYQQEFMREDTLAGQIQAFLDDYKGEAVCTLMLYREALGHEYDKPKTYEISELNDIMRNAVTGWTEGTTKRFPVYGTQRSWVRKAVNEPVNKAVQESLFTELTDKDDDFPF